MNTKEVWLRRAEGDFKAALLLQEHGMNAPSTFHYQQAAEKALKYGWLKNSLPLQKTHDCYVLASKLEATQEILYSADLLTSFYIMSRYPDVGIANPTPEETEKAKKAAEEILKWIKKKYSQK
ncbi:MAG: HEPN domain-containing protein [Candidatus Woesearchaeota archaeon]